MFFIFMSISSHHFCWVGVCDVVQSLLSFSLFGWFCPYAVFMCFLNLIQKGFSCDGKYLLFQFQDLTPCFDVFIIKFVLTLLFFSFKFKYANRKIDDKLEKFHDNFTVLSLFSTLVFSQYLEKKFQLLTWRRLGNDEEIKNSTQSRFDYFSFVSL